MSPCVCKATPCTKRVWQNAGYKKPNNLQQENATHQLSDRALTALALLIAESNPNNKDLMLRLTVNLLAAGHPERNTKEPEHV